MDESFRPRRPRGHGESSLPTAARAAQPSLFGDEPTPAHQVHPATRATDPATSHAAQATAERGLTLKQLAVLAAFQSYAYYFSGGRFGMIDETLVDYYGRDHTNHTDDGARGDHPYVFVGREWWPKQTASGLRTRRKELVRLGYIADSGQKGETAAGSRSIKWTLTEAGFPFPVRGHVERLRMRARMRGPMSAP
jgi:hypothetical protein